MLIVAGAGSGKDQGADEQDSPPALRRSGSVRILALTFTKKAAGEMKERE